MSKLLKVILSCSAIIAFDTNCNGSEMTNLNGIERNNVSSPMGYKGYPSEADYLLSKVDINLRNGIKNSDIEFIKTYCSNFQNLSNTQQKFESYCIGQYCNPLVLHRCNSWIFDIFKKDNDCYELILRFFEICNRMMNGCFYQKYFDAKYETSVYHDVVKDFSKSVGQSGIAVGVDSYLLNIVEADRSDYKISSEFMKNIKQVVDNKIKELKLISSDNLNSQITESNKNFINIVKNFNVIGNEILQLQNDMYVTLYKLIEKYANTSQDTNNMKKLKEKVQALILPAFDVLKEVNKQLQALKPEIQTINNKQPQAQDPKLSEEQGAYVPKEQVVRKYCRVIDYINSIFDDIHIQNVFKYY